MAINPKPKPPKGKSRRGFALMKELDPERQRAISQAAGQRSQSSKAGWRWTKKEARAMAAKGGRARWRHKKLLP